MEREVIYKKKMKIQKYVEIQQHGMEQPVGQRRNQKKKYLETNENGNTAY